MDLPNRSVTGDPRPGTRRRAPNVILCGPFPSSGVIGGYARCNELMATSFLDDLFGVERLAVTVPGEGGSLRRMLVDLQRVRRCLARCPAPIFHLTAQYLRGTYREYVLFRLAKRAGRAFVLDIRAGTFIDCYQQPGAWLRRRLLRAMVTGADAVTVEGRRYVGWLAERFGVHATYFPNFVQAQHRRVYPSASLERPAPGRPARLAYAGRLIASKGLEESIVACGLLQRQGIPVELHLAGPGEDKYLRRLRRAAEAGFPGGRVVFHGALSHDRLLTLLSTCHVFVFPTRWEGEGHSNAVNEAMQVGLPVLATRHGFLEDVVTPECGALLPEVDARGIASALADLCSDWERLRACGKAARERVYGEFSDEVALGRVAEVYARLLRARGA